MATANDTVLVEIITAANLAGINAVRASLFGLNPSLVALAAVIGATYEVGKAAVANSEAQARSEANLSNAIKDRNAISGKANDPKAIADVEKAQAALAKAQQALGLEEDRLAAKRKLTKADLDELKIKNDAVTKAQQNLAAANAAVAASHQTVTYSQQVLQDQIRSFMVSNRDFISNQNDVRDGFAAFIRMGVPVNDLFKAMNAAVDISVGEHISLGQAVDLLQSAETGRATGLRKLVGVQLENVSATATEADKLAIAHRNLLLIGATYDGTRNNLTQYERTQNGLNQDWQTFTAQIGPGVVSGLDDITRAADFGVRKLIDLDNALVAIGNDNQAWANVQNAILGQGQNIPGSWNQKQAVGANYQSVNFGNVHARPNIVGGAQNTTFYINGATDPGAVARGVARALRSLNST